MIMSATPRSEVEFNERLAKFIEESPVDTRTKVMNFAKYADRQHLTKFLARYEIFRHILDVQGAIVECGVYHGGGLLGWGQFCSIHEPFNYVRKVIGFDTFSGFPEEAISDHDRELAHVDRRDEYPVAPRSLNASGFDEIQNAIDIFDMNRPIGHVRKIELVKGDARITIPAYVDDNPHLVVALLNLDFDLYEPTKVAIETLLPRMPKGGVIVFDEINNDRWPGETKALVDSIGIHSLRIKRIPIEPMISYAVIE